MKSILTACRNSALCFVHGVGRLPPPTPQSRAPQLIAPVPREKLTLLIILTSLTSFFKMMLLRNLCRCVTTPLLRRMNQGIAQYPFTHLSIHQS